jgi:hypothetical protein
VPEAGQEYNAATVSKLDAVSSRFILMPMRFDACQRFKLCAAAGCQHPSFFSTAAFVL